MARAAPPRPTNGSSTSSRGWPTRSRSTPGSGWPPSCSARPSSDTARRPRGRSSTAPALFAALTLGSFRGLRVEYDEHDQPLLQAVRPGGAEAVGIRGLSLGTADQLYLALRLASLETALDSRGPVPLIADDILIQFDDGRTAAALQLLAGLSDRTQIILFTHHEHVCDLARSILHPDRLFIHRLPGRVA